MRLDQLIGTKLGIMQMNLHMQSVHEDKVKAKHGYDPGHLCVWNSEQSAKQMLLPLVPCRIVAHSDCSIEVGGLEE